jgi:hypothetical protein
MPRTAWTARVAALLILGVGPLAACGTTGNRARAAQSMKCVPESKLYGPAPARFEYRQLKGEEAKQAIKTINFEDAGVGHVDVTVAQGPRDSDIAILSSFRRTNASDDLEGFIDGAKGVGATVRREGDIAWIKPTGGGTTAVAVNGCHFVMVIGDAEPVVRKLAPTVLAE